MRAKFSVGDKVKIVKGRKSLIAKTGKVREVHPTAGFYSHCYYRVATSVDDFWMYSWQLEKLK